MAKSTSKKQTDESVVINERNISLGALLSAKAVFQRFHFWIVGDTPLITHAWSEKARRQMLQKQTKATKDGTEARNPTQDFEDAIYDMGGKDKFGRRMCGFPVTGIKNCILSCAHKDKGIARTDARASLFLDAEMVRVRPALAGAICDLPLVRIWGDGPIMREDSVIIGGMSKTATLAYRPQFTRWAIHITGRFNPKVLTADALATLVQQAGLITGIGEWKNASSGIFGSFHLADGDEEAQWESFAEGKGEVPTGANYKMAAE